MESFKLQIMPMSLVGTSGDCLPFTSAALPKIIRYIEETLIVGQDYASNRVEELIHSAQDKNIVSQIGLVGMGGSSKTLLIKKVFNNIQVQTLFSNDGLMLWLTISKNPFFNALRNELVKQIAVQISERLEGNDEEYVKIWLNGRLSENKFPLFLDDVWETSANSLLAELCVPLLIANSNIIIFTSKSNRVLKRLGVPDASTVQVEQLREDDSWRLFGFHAFPHSDGIMPLSIDHEIARCVYSECGGLPLALKVIGQAMAGVAHSNEWELALKSLRNVKILVLYSILEHIPK